MQLARAIADSIAHMLINVHSVWLAMIRSQALWRYTVIDMALQVSTHTRCFKEKPCIYT